MVPEAISRGDAALSPAGAVPSTVGDGDIDLAQPVIERRRHIRFAINLLGRFMRANKQEYPCRLNDISVGGVAVMSPVDVEIDERIIVYLDQLGGIEGTVVRLLPGGFALKVKATPYKREKLAAQITWLINRPKIEGPDARRAGHERTAMANKPSLLRLPDGSEIEVGIQDVSISGASITTKARLPNGQEVCLGKLRALVVRQHAEGVGVQFLDIQNPDALRRYFG